MKPLPPIDSKKLFRWVLWGGLSIIFIVSVGFTDSRSDSQPVNGLETIIDDSTGHSFLVADDLQEIVASKYGDLVERPIGSINMALLEKCVLSNPYVSGARVFSTIDGKLHVEASQRDPILRVINFENQGFYIDDNGEFMPLSDKYTARVPVANGYLFVREAEQHIRTRSEGEASDTMAKVPAVEQVFRVAKFIHDDTFWSSQIEQMYVNENGDIELIPRVGDHTIMLGDASGLEEKFDRLYRFYTEGLSKTGWNKYKNINLKYAGQIVCTKR